MSRATTQKKIVVLPGDYRVKQGSQQTAKRLDVPLEILPDTHFYSTPEEFAEFAEGRRSLLLETFYRQMRQEA